MKLLRDRQAGETPRVTNPELFFDLVYVFAITQLSHRLLIDLTPRGALEALVLFLAVWWAWNLTAWATNWADPETAPVRALMVGLMLVSLIMAAAIPAAFSTRGASFAIAYVLLQLIRSGFMIFAFRLDDSRMQRNFAQLLAWSAISGVFWIAGAGLHGHARLAVWIFAVALDYAAPIHGFWLPRFGITPLSDWTLAGGHLAERNQLVILIALGESLLAAGATFSEIDSSLKALASLIVGFLGTVSLWWVYFVRFAPNGEELIEHAPEATKLGRNGFAYAHGIMVAGIIVVSVAIELMMRRPDGKIGLANTFVLIGGPALYLAGNAIFNFTLTGRIPGSRLIGIAALVVTTPLAWFVSPLAMGAVTMLIMLALAAATGAARLPATLAR